MTDDTSDGRTDDRSDDSEPSDDDGIVDPDLPSGRRAASEGGRVLSPEELDISNSEYVEPLDDRGRYVVSPGGGPPKVSRPTDDERRSASDDDNARKSDSPSGRDGSDSRLTGDPHGTGGITSPETARTLLASELAQTDSRYGIDVVARFNGETVRHRSVSNDVVATFETLVRWYAQHVTDEATPDEVIDILLQETSFGGETTPNLAELLESHDLSTADSIEDLVGAISADADRER